MNRSTVLYCGLHHRGFSIATISTEPSLKTKKKMEPNEKKAFEPSGLVPRSIVRTFERFRQQLLPGSETAAIREYRISRYQVLVSARCLLTLLIIPIATNWLISSWLLSPLVEHFWNTQQNEIFLNSYQEERAFAELEFFSEKLFFDSLLTERDVKAMTIKMVDTEPFDQLVRHSSKTKDVKEIISPTMPELSFIGNTKLPTYSCPIDTARNAFGDRGIAIHTSPSQQDSHCLLRTFFEGNEYSKPSLHSSIGQILQPGMHRHFVQKQNDCNDGSNGNVRSLPSSVLRIVEVSNAKRVQGVRNTVGQGILKDYESISFSEDPTVLVNKVSFTELKKHQNPVPSVLRDYTTFVAFPFWSINSIRPITLNTSSDHNPLSSYTPFFLPYHKKAFLAESDLCIPIEEKKAPPGNQFLDRTCWYHTSQSWRFINKMTPEDNYHSHTNNFLGGNLLTTHLSESRTTSQNLCLQCSIPNQLRKTNFCTTYGLAKLVDTASPLTITTFCPINDWTEGSYCTGSGTKMTSTAKEHFTMENEIDSLKLKEKIQEKILELAIYYNQQTISSITNIIGDLISILTLVCLFIWMKPEIAILKSFLVEAIYSLSDTTKSFLLILLTDLLVGFHSPRGWETALELLLKHFGLPENQDFVFLFVATFPVLLDTVFKYWIFRHLNKISPSTVATYHSMIE